MKTDDKKEFILILVFMLVFLVGIWLACHYTYINKELDKKYSGPQPIYIDSTQVQVVYTDTWGKIFIMKEEDL